MGGRLDCDGSINLGKLAWHVPRRQTGLLIEQPNKGRLSQAPEVEIGSQLEHTRACLGLVHPLADDSTAYNFLSGNTCASTHNFIKLITLTGRLLLYSTVLLSLQLEGPVNFLLDVPVL